MSVSDARKAWQQWKKAHSSFAANRDAKLDLGPKLDALEKAHAAWLQSAKQTEALQKREAAALDAVAKTVQEYRKVVVKSGDKALQKSFDAQLSKYIKEEVQEEIRMEFNFADSLANTLKSSEAEWTETFNFS